MIYFFSPWLIGMMDQEATVGKISLMNVTMKDDLVVLEDVVVTGYQDMPKEKVTEQSSISSAKIEGVTQPIF